VTVVDCYGRHTLRVERGPHGSHGNGNDAECTVGTGMGKKGMEMGLTLWEWDANSYFHTPAQRQQTVHSTTDILHDWLIVVRSHWRTVVEIVVQ